MDFGHWATWELLQHVAEDLSKGRTLISKDSSVIMGESDTPVGVAFSWTERHFCLPKVITYIIRSDCQSLYRRIYEQACLATAAHILRKDDSPGRRRSHNAKCAC
jgi:hypothetical protein